MRKIPVIILLLILFGFSPPAMAQYNVPPASRIRTDTSAFGTNLSSADNTVQKALDTLDEAAGGASISDAVYGAGWNGDTTTGASKNALYDKIELLAALNSPIFTDDFDLAAAGVRFGGANGILTLLGLGDGADENLIIDFNTTANGIGVSSSSGAMSITFASIDLFVPTEIYDATGWDGDLSVPTKDAVRDKIEAIVAGTTSLTDIADATADGEIAAGAYQTVITSTIDHATNNTLLSLKNTDADNANDTYLMKLLFNDDGDANSFFMAGFDNAYADLKWSIGADGAATFGSLTTGSSGTGQIDIGSSGVRITDDGDGAITFLGLGNGSDEDLTINLDDTANTAVISSSTGVNKIDVGSMALASTANMPGVPHTWRVSIVDGNGAGITTGTIIPLGYAPAALTVTNVRAETSSASYEIAGDVKYADARIGLANAAVINDFDTTSGVRNDSTITSAAVASGKFVYLLFDSAPNASDTDDSIVVTWDFD